MAQPQGPMESGVGKSQMQVQRRNMTYPICYDGSRDRIQSSGTVHVVGFPPSYAVTEVSHGHIQGAGVGYPPRLAESHRGNCQACQSSMSHPPSLMESLSVTTVNQGFPLSSTYVHHSQQESRHQQNLPEMSLTTRGPKLLDGVSLFTPGFVDDSSHDHKVSHSEGYPAGVTQHAHVLGDRTNHPNMAELLSSPTHAAAPTWHSLPSATPDERKGIRLMAKEQSCLSESCKEVGTQTLNVDTVATQTDNIDKYSDHVMKELDRVTRESVETSPSTPVLTEKSIASSAMSMGDLAPSVIRKPLPLEHPTEDDNHSPQELSQSSLDEITLIEELLATSELSSCPAGLSGRLWNSQQSAVISSTSKGMEVSLTK